MTGLQVTRSKLTGRFAIAAFAFIVASSACAEWSLQNDGIPPVAEFPGAIDVWVYESYPMSIECSPPWACYAKSQWFHAYIHCNSRSIAMIQRLPMDLNGDIFAVVDYSEDFSFKLPRSDAEHGLVGRFCGGLRIRDDDDHDRPSHNLRHQPVDPSKPAPGGTDRVRPTR